MNAAIVPAVVAPLSMRCTSARLRRALVITRLAHDLRNAAHPPSRVMVEARAYDTGKPMCMAHCMDNELSLSRHGADGGTVLSLMGSAFALDDNETPRVARFLNLEVSTT